MSRVKHSGSFDIAHPVERLFPLFSAEGETLWDPGWAYENVMGSTELHEDYVFLTDRHDHAATRAVWIVKRYEPGEHLIELYKVEADEKVGVVAVRCVAADAERTSIEVTYEYIGLSESGDEFVRGFTAEAFGELIAAWRTMLERYFAALPASG